MKFRTLGQSDLRVSIATLGCANFGARVADDVAAAIIDAAFEQGINFFDTADVYGGRGGSERVLGRFLGARRKDIVLATKFGRPMDAEGKGGGASRRYVSEAVDACLGRLATDWIDLLQIHWPYPAVAIEETLRGFEDVIAAGKVRHVGLSNFAGWQLVEAQLTARHHGLPQCVSTQDEYNLLVRKPEQELLPAARAYGVSLLPYLPLAGGFLTGKYQPGGSIAGNARFAQMPEQQRYLTAENFRILEGMAQLAARSSRNMVELAFGWLATRDGVASILTGPSRPEQVALNVAAANVELRADELAALDRLVSRGAQGDDHP